MAFVLKMQSACPGEHFEGKQVFEKNKKFHLFRALRGKISNCRQTKVSRVFKIALYVSRWTFRGIFSWHKINIFPLSLPDFEQTTMGLLRKKNQHSRQNCIYVCSEMSWGFSRKIFISFHQFWTLSAKEYRTSGGKYAACSSKMQSGCPREHFEKKTTFLKEKYIYVLTDRFWLPAIFFQKIGENVSARLIRLHFTCPAEELEQKFFSVKVVLLFIFVTSELKNFRCLA